MKLSRTLTASDLRQLIYNYFGLISFLTLFGISPIAHSFDQKCVFTGPLIHQIQGQNFESYYEGVDTKTAGVVTGVFPKLQGFTLQTPRRFEDDTEKTSEAIFVYTGQNFDQQLPKVNEVVSVSGRVDEYKGMTQLEVKSMKKLCNETYDVTVLKSLKSSDGLEEYEAMKVELNNAKVGSVDELDLFGSFAVSHPYVDGLLRIDDGSNSTRPQSPFGDATADIELGVIIPKLEGVLLYGFNRFRLHLVKQLAINAKTEKTKIDEAPEISLDNQGDLRVLSLNAENYFNGRVQSQGVNYSNSRGPRNKFEYILKKTNLAKFIRELNPDIIALQEIENDLHEQRPAIVDLINNLESGRQRYSLIELGKLPQRLLGSDQITQIIIVKKTSGLRVIDAPLSYPNPHAGRPLLVQKFRFSKGRAQQHFLLATSHLKSKRNTCGDDEHCTLKRLAEGRAFSAALKELSDKQGLPVLWVGDFNSTPNEPTMTYLRSQDWRFLLPQSSYSYVYKGQQNLLDHALWLNASTKSILPSWLTRSDAVLVPKAQVFNINNGPKGYGRNNDLERVSDHDPVVIDFVLQ